MCGEKCIDVKCPLNVYYNDVTMNYAVYVTNDHTVDANLLSTQSPPIIHTIDAQRYISCIDSCVQHSDLPLLLVGDAGCGKSLLITHALDVMKSTITTVMHCSANTNTTHVKQKLYEIMSGSTILRPKNGKQYAVLVFKNINLPLTDQYNTSQVHSFIHQLYTYHGFYDNNNEWITVDGLRIIGTMNAKHGNSMTRRLTGNMNIIHIDYTDKLQLSTIVSVYLNAVLNANQQLYDKSLKQSSQSTNLVNTIVDLYYKLQSEYHTIVAYTPRDVIELLCSLLRYNLNTQSVLDVCVWEYKRIFGDKLSTDHHKQQFTRMLAACFSSWKINVNQPDIHYTSLHLILIDDPLPLTHI